MSKSQENDKESKDKAFLWTDEEAASLLSICQEYHKQNGVDTHFNWGEIAERFGKEHGKKICGGVAKNKFDYMKKTWRLWCDLRFKETGVGWDAELGKIKATEEWWARKIQEKSKYRRFRDKPPSPELSELWDSVYGTICATGKHCVSATMDVSVSQPPASGSVQPRLEQLLDMNDDFNEEELLRDFTQTEGTQTDALDSQPTETTPKKSMDVGCSQRPLKRKKKSSTAAASIVEHMAGVDKNTERMLTLLEGDVSSNNVGDKYKFYKLEDALEVIERWVKAGTLEEVSQIWCFAIEELNQENSRKLFMTLKSDKAKLAWLRYKFKKVEGESAIP